jgi:ribosomal protein L29
MKKKDIKKLKEKTIQKLKEKAQKDKIKLKQAMAEFYGKGDNNPKKIRQLKKDVAQTLTILRQKEIEKEVRKKSKSKEESK